MVDLPQIFLNVVLSNSVYLYLCRWQSGSFLICHGWLCDCSLVIMNWLSIIPSCFYFFSFFRLNLVMVSVTFHSWYHNTDMRDFFLLPTDTPPPAYQAREDSHLKSMTVSQNNNALLHAPHHPPSRQGPQPMDTSSVPAIPIPKNVAGRGVGKKWTVCVSDWIIMNIFSITPVPTTPAVAQQWRDSRKSICVVPV